MINPHIDIKHGILEQNNLWLQKGKEGAQRPDDLLFKVLDANEKRSVATLSFNWEKALLNESRNLQKTAAKIIACVALIFYGLLKAYLFKKIDQKIDQKIEKLETARNGILNEAEIVFQEVAQELEDQIRKDLKGYLCLIVDYTTISTIDELKEKLARFDTFTRIKILSACHQGCLAESSIETQMPLQMKYPDLVPHPSREKKWEVKIYLTSLLAHVTFENSILITEEHLPSFTHKDNYWINLESNRITRHRFFYNQVQLGLEKGLF